MRSWLPERVVFKCKACSEFKPRNGFYVKRWRDKTGLVRKGRHALCMPCYTSYMYKWRQAKKERENAAR